MLLVTVPLLVVAPGLTVVVELFTEGFEFGALALVLALVSLVAGIFEEEFTVFFPLIFAGPVVPVAILEGPVVPVAMLEGPEFAFEAGTAAPPVAGAEKDPGRHSRNHAVCGADR